jgi:ABC-type transport system substrate-binding protein
LVRQVQADSPQLRGAMALNVSFTTSDVSFMARYFLSAYFSPNGFNFEHWKDDKFEAALTTLAESTDPAAIEASYRTAHERMVDNPPWLFIVHDLNPSFRRSRGSSTSPSSACTDAGADLDSRGCSRADGGDPPPAALIPPISRQSA